jgi:hypothetical protein
MSKQAKGTFTTKATPQEPYDVHEGISLGRIQIAKVFEGDLDASGLVEMIGARTPVAGSAGYVAIERVKGKLHNQEGTFVLQHNGIMDRGAPSLTVSVVPDSGTGQLTGLRGQMSIDIKDGEHFYTFDYTLKE